MNDRSIVETSSPYGNDVHFPLNEYETAPNTPLIDTAWIRGALYRQRWLIAACIGAGLLIGLVLTLLTTPIYQASATARIAPWGYFIVEGQDVSSPVNSANEIDGFLSTLGAVVKSRNLAEVVAEGLPEGTANALLPEDFDENRPAELNDEQWEAQRQNRVVDTLMAGVGAQVPRINRIMTLTFDSPDPVLAMDVANAYAVAFSQSDTRRSIVSNTYAREYLLGEIEDVRERLAQSERATNAYARDAGIVTPQTTGGGGEGGQTITGANLSSLNQNLGAAKAKRIAAEQRWRTIENTPAAELPFVQNNSVVQNLVSNRAQLEGELTNLKRRYNDSFPEIVDINARIDLLNQQIEEVGNNLKAGVRSEFVIAQNEEAALQAELYAATDNALDEQEQKIEFTGLESEAVALRGRLNQLLDRYNQLSTASNVQSGAITILDRAVLPQSPIAPNFLQNMIFALLIGTVLAGGLAIAREIFVDQFRRLEDVRDRLNLPVLGVTPFVKEDELEEEEANQYSSLVEAYASVQSTIDFAIPREGAVLQLTSSQAAEGKSTTSLILAELFARLGRKTLLIDADLRKPSITKLLQVEKSGSGVTEVLLGHAPFQDSTIKGVHENLDILPVVGIPPNPVELISSIHFRNLIEEQRENYQLILIDSSPVLGLADAPQLARLVDGSIFIIEANRTSFSQANAALNRLYSVGANVLGGVLTKYRARDAGADYGYQYQYYQYGNEKV